MISFFTFAEAGLRQLIEKVKDEKTFFHLQKHDQARKCTEIVYFLAENPGIPQLIKVKN